MRDHLVLDPRGTQYSIHSTPATAPSSHQGCTAAHSRGYYGFHYTSPNAEAPGMYTAKTMCQVWGAWLHFAVLYILIQATYIPEIYVTHKK